MGSFESYVKHVAGSHTVVRVGGVPWRMARRMLEPLPMPHRPVRPDRGEVRRAMKETGAALARWHDAWDTEPCDWWWICCDDPAYDVERFGKRARRSVRVGLRRCEVRQVQADWLAENGYRVYASAHERYGGQLEPSPPEKFADAIRRMADCEAIEIWGGFAESSLIAYAVCLVFDHAVNLSAVKSDPEMMNKQANSALVYELTRHYLTERHMAYVTDGCRTLHHQTSFQEFLERMGYRRIYCPLRAEFARLPALVLATGLPRWGPRLGLGKLAPRAVERLRAVDRVADIAAASRTIPPADGSRG